MKKPIISFVLVLFAFVSFSQITLDKKYDYSTSVIKLETSGYKYYLMDIPAEQCRIYNMDHSLYKTINLNVPNGYYLADIKYISENLFDNDSGIELLYTYYKYVPTNDSYYYIYGSKIANDNGSVMLTIEGSRYNYINKTEEEEYQLFSYCFDYSAFPEIVWTNIYNLPGTLYSSVAIVKNQDDFFINTYPNPATKSIKIEYELPENINTGELYFFYASGQMLSQYNIDNHTNFLEIDVRILPKGMYYYFVEYGNERSESKKVMVQ